MKFYRPGFWWLGLLATAFFFSPIDSVAQNSSSGQATLSGIVVKDPGGEPVKKALIELIAESQAGGGNHTALTGLDGGFRIENIAPGSFRLFVERAGFQEVDKHHRRADGRLIALSPGQELKDLVIRLQPAAVVEGRVTDEDGDPMPDSQVAVFRQTYLAGRTHWEQTGAERTNDLGDYRIPSLPAGSYFLCVTPPPDFRSFIEDAGAASTLAHPAATENAAPPSYQTTYYPGTRDRSQATAIQIHAGDDFPANFSLTPGPSFSIRGSVTNLPPGSSASITLQSKDFNVVLSGAEVHKDGSFAIRDVSPGAYTISASLENVASPMTARQSIQVSSENLEGVRLAPQAAGSIRGRMRLETGGKRVDVTQVFLMLRGLDSEEGGLSSTIAEDNFSAMAHVNADGSFAWESVPAGRYSVQISDPMATPDWFIKALAANGRDALDNGFNVGAGTTLLDLLASPNGAVIEGIATGEKDQPIGDSTVVAVPDPPYRAHSDRYREATSDQSGHFVLHGLPPGDYTVFAWDSVEGEAYYNAEFLQKYEGRGKSLHVNEGDRTSLKLVVISGDESQSPE